ncbi:MAG: Fe-S cluster assembly protein SufD [Alphaproteobacteria bacterium]
MTMNAVTPMRTGAEAALIAAYGVEKKEFPGGAAVNALRDAAFARFEAKGLPHRRVEEWKYTDLRALMRDARPLAATTDVDGLSLAAELVSRAKGSFKAIPIVIIDGQFIGALSGRLPDGVTVTGLSDALVAGRADISEAVARAEERFNDPLMALNTMFLRDGVIIDVAAGTVVHDDLHIISVVTAAHFVSSRHFVTVGAGASIGILESHVGPADVDYQKNTVLHVVVGEGATLEHGRRQTEGDKALHIASLVADIGPNAHFDTLTVTTGGAVSRNQLFVRFGGENSKATLRGVTMLRHKQHADTTLVMDHAVPNCESREMFKTILDHEAKGVFQGKIIVAPHAQKTDGRMMSQTIMLADGPEMANKPELEIFADDVQCAHGCTVGELDEDLMFYLKSRGVPHKEAEALLVEAFAREAIEDFGEGTIAAIDDLRAALLGSVTDWMLSREG